MLYFGIRSGDLVGIVYQSGNAHAHDWIEDDRRHRDVDGNNQPYRERARSWTPVMSNECPAWGYDERARPLTRVLVAR